MARRESGLRGAQCMSILMPKDLMTALAAAAAKQTVPMSAFVRQSLMKALEAEKEAA